MIKCPEKCLCCGAPRFGGCTIPGENMKEGRRVFFECGASMSYKKLEERVYQILYKNCLRGE